MSKKDQTFDSSSVVSRSIFLFSEVNVRQVGQSQECSSCLDEG
jgi:hypothetical protein